MDFKLIALLIANLITLTFLLLFNSSLINFDESLNLPKRLNYIFVDISYMDLHIFNIITDPLSLYLFFTFMQMARSTKIYYNLQFISYNAFFSVLSILISNWIIKIHRPFQNQIENDNDNNEQ
jgi:hypothetical protein